MSFVILELIAGSIPFSFHSEETWLELWFFVQQKSQWHQGNGPTQYLSLQMRKHSFWYSVILRFNLWMFMQHFEISGHMYHSGRHTVQPPCWDLLPHTGATQPLVKGPWSQWSQSTESSFGEGSIWIIPDDNEQLKNDFFTHIYWVFSRIK